MRVFFFLAAFRRRQTEEHILCTVNRYNSLMDQWITSCGSQSIGLLLSKHAAESVGREIWAAGVEVHAFLRIDKHIDRTLIEQQLYQLFFWVFHYNYYVLMIFFLYKWLNFTAFFFVLVFNESNFMQKVKLVGLQIWFFPFLPNLTVTFMTRMGTRYRPWITTGSRWMWEVLHR